MPKRLIGRLRRLAFEVRPHEAALGGRDASRPRAADMSPQSKTSELA